MAPKLNFLTTIFFVCVYMTWKLLQRGDSARGASAWELGSVDPGPVLGVARLLQISLERDEVIEGPQFMLSSPLALCLNVAHPSHPLGSQVYPFLAS